MSGFVMFLLAVLMIADAGYLSDHGETAWAIVAGVLALLCTLCAVHAWSRT